MSDIKSAEERSKNMSAIKGKNTKPEIYIRKKLFARGYRYRTYSNHICGHPDIWLRKYNTVIFVHGCFWHRHKECKYAYMPKSKIEFWDNKFQNNMKRDQYVKNELYLSGIKCLVIWECTIKKMKKNPEYEVKVIDQIIEFMESEDSFWEL